MNTQVRVWDPALGRERAASVAELVQIHGGRPVAAPMPPGGRPLPPPPSPSERLAAAMAQARVWSLDPTVPAAQRRKLARSVAAYEGARAQRAEAAKLRADFEALETKVARMRSDARAERLKARRAEARHALEAWDCYSHAAAVDRYLRTGEARYIERYV